MAVFLRALIRRIFSGLPSAKKPAAPEAAPKAPASMVSGTILIVEDSPLYPDSPQRSTRF